MNDRKEAFTKRTEILDIAKIFELALENSKSEGSTQSLSWLLQKISSQDKELAESFQKTSAGVISEIIHFYERTREGYKRSIGRPLFSKDGELQRETKASHFAMKETKRLFGVADNLLKQSEARIVNARKEMASAFTETLVKLIEGVNSNRLIQGDGNGRINPSSKRVEEELEDFVEGVLTD